MPPPQLQVGLPGAPGDSATRAAGSPKRCSGLESFTPLTGPWLPPPRGLTASDTILGLAPCRAAEVAAERRGFFFFFLPCAKLFPCCSLQRWLLTLRDSREKRSGAAALVSFAALLPGGGRSSELLPRALCPSPASPPRWRGSLPARCTSASVTWEERRRRQLSKERCKIPKPSCLFLRSVRHAVLGRDDKLIRRGAAICLGELRVGAGAFSGLRA